MDERALREDVERLPARIAALRAEVERLRRPEAHEAEVRSLKLRLADRHAQRDELRTLCVAGRALAARVDAHVTVELPPWKRRLAAARLGPPRGPVEPIPPTPPGRALHLPGTLEALGFTVAAVMVVLGLAAASCLVLGWLFP